MPVFSLYENIWEQLSGNLPNLSRFTLILPGQRAAAYLRSQISARLDGPVLSPRILTIQQWVEEISGLQTADSYELFLELYPVYQSMAPDDKVSFDQFTTVGGRILRDFDDIDRYLLPVDKLFAQLSAWGNLSRWGLEEGDSTASLIESLSHMLGMLEPLYTEFTEKLLSKDRGYSGLVYRIACEKIDGYLDTRHKTNRFLFAGFNALSKSEEHLITRILDRGLGEIYWDIEESFLNDEVHDMGFFIRRYRRNWAYYQTHPLCAWRPEEGRRPQIRIYSCSDPIQQAKVARTIISEGDPKQSLAVVPCDEYDTDLLLAQFYDERGSSAGVNITAGLSYQRHPAYAFVYQLLSLQDRETGSGWNLELLRKLVSVTLPGLPVSHPLYRTLQGLRSFGSSASLSRFELRDIRKLDGLDPGWKERILTTVVQGQPYVSSLLSTFREVQSALNQPSQVIQDFLHFLERSFGKDGLPSGEASPRTILRMFQLYAQGKRLYFRSDPLAEIQITGILETRNLSYPNIVLTTVNEGVLPPTPSNNSLIPHGLRSDFGLPGPKEKDAIYAYHFYRLLAHAQSAHILFCSLEDEWMGSERSRFVSQLVLDPPQRFDVSEIAISTEPQNPNLGAVEIRKTDALLHALHELCARGISASALYSYLTDPRSFYFERLLGLSRTHDTSRELPPNLFGNVVHLVLQELMQDFVGRSPSGQDLQQLRGHVPGIVRKHYLEVLEGLDVLEGIHFLSSQAVEKTVLQFLEKEIIQAEKSPFTLISTERSIEASINTRDGGSEWRIKGIIDRIETTEGAYRVLDYKTGGFADSDLCIPEDLGQIFERIKRFKELFQLLFYGLLVREELRGRPLQLGIISMVSHGGSRHYAYWPNKKSVPASIPTELLDEFESLLKERIEELIHPDIPLLPLPEGS